MNEHRRPSALPILISVLLALLLSNVTLPDPLPPFRTALRPLLVP